MPLQNRVDPAGRIFAHAARGLWLGNRGVLHDGTRTIRREWQVRRWITCHLDYGGRHREVMQPGRYTELFFLDEATALAAGHRPCGECRHADHVRFRDLWTTVHPADPVGVDWIDRRLHAERLDGHRRKRSAQAELMELPDGAIIARDGGFWLVRDRRLLEWSPAGYTRSAPRPRSARVELLTPPSVVAVLRAGYRGHIHPTADAL